MVNNSESGYWYNVKTGEVERGMVSPAAVRIGPFPTAAAAANAPEVVRRRAAEWAAEDAQRDAE